ncbi:sodium-dependent transporter [Petroclostridium xylanilyticum]|uniref:sodium-dependent transporter n=1 Tax=Petroclostridium xylanilyticum TaxID=1792311 RepID=UPI000B98EA6D|nr:sodium-dependent transporter [Petroclostridium xylanilyticum]
MAGKRDQWGTKIGFILAAIGSAIGLGNIWRYPYIAYSNGGGAFLIPYFFALFTAGIPLMILEYSIGHKFRGATPAALARANKKWEWLGWWPSVNSIVILIYYSMILGWALNYVFLAFTRAWGDDPNKYFFGQFLGLTDSPWNLGTMQWHILIAMAVIWFANWYICFKGVSDGIEKANKVLLPMLFVIMIIIVIRGVTLPGAVQGLETLLHPDWSKVLDFKVWIAAYGQIFFSLSLAMGVMMTYASYLPKKTDIVNSAFFTALANSGFEFLAALGVFSILGYMAHVQNLPVDKVVTSSIGLAFVVFPQGMNMMPGIFKVLLGVLFFAGLVFAGMTSSVSMVEAFSAPFIDKFGIRRKKIVTIICIGGFAISTLFATGAGLFFLDIIDNFINSFGAVIIGLSEAIVIGWLFGTQKVREHVNPISHYPVGKWWDVTVKFVTPAVLIYMLINNIIENISKPYGGYPMSAVVILGWLVAAGTVAAGLILASRPWAENTLNNYEDYEAE